MTLKGARIVPKLTILASVSLLSACGLVTGFLASLSLSPRQVNLVLGGTSSQAEKTITVNAEDIVGGPDSFTAYSSDTSVADIKNKMTTSFVVYAVGNGSAYITVSSGSGKSETVDVTVSGSIDGASADLSALSASGLNLAFDSATRTYALNAPTSLASTTVTATAADGASTVSINGGADAAVIPLSAGTNSIRIVVTGSDGITQKTYTLTITKAAVASSDAGLTSLYATGLNIPFTANSASFSATAPNSLASTSISAIPAQAGAAVLINGQQVIGNGSITVGLGSGATTVPITVTAPDGITRMYYTLTISKTASTSSDASLTMLSASGLNLAFNASTSSYSLNAPSSQNSTSIAAYPTQAGSSIAINGQAAVAGTGLPISLSTGSNSVIVLVTAPDGTTTRTYTIAITKAAPPSSVATLSNLTVTGITPSLIFGADTTYTLTASASLASVAIAAAPSDTGATVSINGSSGSTYSMTLSTGTNTATITVTAADKVTKKTYYVYINKAASTNAALQSLTASGLSLSPGFYSTTYSYSLSAANSVSSTTINASPADAASTYTVNGSGSGYVPLNVGRNTVTIVVTAPDGVTKKTYTLNIARALPAPTIKVQHARYYASSSSPYLIYLTWDADPQIYSRQIYAAASKTGSYALIGSTTETSLYHCSATPGTTYFFKMTATDANGIVSDFSPIASGTTCDAYGMPVVQYLPYTGPDSMWPTMPDSLYYAMAISAPNETTDNDNNCAVLRFGGYTYWVPTDYRYTYELVVTLFDSAGSYVREWPARGDRYLWDIGVDDISREIHFKGQATGINPGPDPTGQGVVLTWDSLDITPAAYRWSPSR